MQWNVIDNDRPEHHPRIVAEVYGPDAKKMAAEFAAAAEAIAACEALIFGAGDDYLQAAIDKARTALRKLGRIE